MKSFSNTSRLSVYRIGEAAQDLLKSDSEGRVLAVISTVIYLETIYNELLWLVTDNIPMHRRGIQIRVALPRVSASSSFRVREKHLLLGYAIDLDLSPVSLWASPHPNLDGILPFEELPDRL